MSKNLTAFQVFSPCFLIILQLFNVCAAQDVEVKVTVSVTGVPQAKVEGRYIDYKPSANALGLSFLNDYAGESDLGKRISELKLSGPNAEPVNYRRLMSGEYLADRTFSAWSYTVDLTSSKNWQSLSHVSWANSAGGNIFLRDLLPQHAGKSAKLTLSLPAGWSACSATISREGVWNMDDLDTAALYVGGSIRRQEKTVNQTRMQVCINGGWQFTDIQALEMATSIYAEYHRLFGVPAVRDVALVFSRLPTDVNSGNWTGDTRGNTLTIVSSDMPFKNQSIQRLHEQLRHEIFHLWVPGQLNLTGSYDWFYEGFGLYQSLKVGVKVNQISFGDMLDTLSRAYDIARSSSRKRSLISSSKDRWSGADTEVYARGMIIAFLADIILLERSKGKLSSDDLIRDIFTTHRKPAPARDGNEAITARLRSDPKLLPIVERYIEGADDISWQPQLEAAGLEADPSTRATTLKIRSKLTGNQKQILDRLGYNSWRRMAARN